MQVVRIVRSLISAGPDDKLSHIENFRANEGWKFEYPSARLSFSWLYPLRRSSRAFLAGFRRSVPTWGLRAYTISSWFDLSNDFSRVCKFANRGTVDYYATIDSRNIPEASRHDWLIDCSS